MIVSQVMPHPRSSSIPVTADYQRLAGESASYAGLEGFVYVRVIAAALRACNGQLHRQCVITALESKTFWRPVTPNTIFVAQDNPAKRKELEQSVLKTFYLSNLSQPTELQDVVNAIRALTQGGPIWHDLWISLAWIIGILLVFVPLSVRRYRNTV